MKKLLLIGGGHSHVEVLRRFALKPDKNAQITLVSPTTYTPYSGMLPGLIAGHYDFQECHIDLSNLARRAQCRFVESEVTGIDGDAGSVTISNGARFDFDVAAIDIGSIPMLGDTKGVHKHAIPVKPTQYFLSRWDELVQQSARQPVGDGYRIVVVGAGAAGIEVLLAMQYRLASTGRKHISCAIVTDSESILPGHRPGVRQTFENILRKRGVTIYRRLRVVEVNSTAILAESGESIPADFVVWATGAAAATWPATSGLSVTPLGFIRVRDTLQSVSHPAVFATGDIASLDMSPRPKSGVYAVRQGPPLAENLRRALNDESLLPYRPQEQALALISSGDRYAVASRGWFFAKGRWVWRWKDHVDRSFMRRYALKP